jgi:hypothetical protein
MFGIVDVLETDGRGRSIALTGSRDEGRLDAVRDLVEVLPVELFELDVGVREVDVELVAPEGRRRAP